MVILRKPQEKHVGPSLLSPRIYKSEGGGGGGGIIRNAGVYNGSHIHHSVVVSSSSSDVVIRLITDQMWSLV